MMEKKQSTIKQTAAKIKTKIHNTSSFFKLSLKTNNKALALALAAQKHRTRQLETESVCLQKDVQALRFELAIQRHKNKQMFTILREIYNSSMNCMAKAVNLISEEEASEGLETHTSEGASQSEKAVSELLPELKNTTRLSKGVEWENVLTTDVNISEVTDHDLCSVNKTDKLLSPDKDRATPQNTLYDSVMEITIVDNIPEIVTVQTQPEKSCIDDQGRCDRNRENVMSSGEMQICDMTSNPPVEVSSEVQAQISMNTTTLTCSNEESLQEQVGAVYKTRESVTALRKTHVISRNSKNNRQTHNSQKLTERNPDSRKTYVVSSNSSNGVGSSSDLDDYFSDLEVTHSEKRSKHFCDVNIPNQIHTESEDETCVIKEAQRDQTANHRKTFVVSRKSRQQKNKKTDVHSFSMDQNASLVKDITHPVDSETHATEMSVQAEEHQSNTFTQSVSQMEEYSTVKNRGTYVIHASKTSTVYNDILNVVTDVKEDVVYGEEANIRSIENTQCTTSVIIERPPKIQKETPVMANKSALNPRASNDENLFKHSSELSVKEKFKPKSSKVDKTNVRKKTVAAREKSNALGKKKEQNFNSNQNIDILATELPDPENRTMKKENSTSCTALLQSAEMSECSTFEGCFRHAPATKQGDANRIYSDNFDSSSYECALDDLDRGLRHVSLRAQNNKGYKSVCKESYVISSNCSSLKAKENNMAFNSTSDDTGFTNEEHGISLLIDERTFMPSNNCDNQSTPRKTEQLRQNPSEFFPEERPPWESLDCGSTEIFTDDNPGSAHSPSTEVSTRTVDIYEEPGENIIHQSPDKRAMKNLTNTDLACSTSGRTRRKAAAVSYKEPSLNCKMRRGDQYSDTRFLSSPLFQEKKKKQIKKNRVK
ncbi:shugoshin 2 [Hoplias malabaricus]|uniref:shugoshin 2 n=1 Tax=Hoplias malabaricus TaxID=27720 RepID=UPI0034618043